MRSRFSAFVVADAAYLLRTWHSSTRPSDLQLDPQQRWMRLEVIAADRGGLFDNVGSVEFRAHYRYQGQADSLHERSRFLREDGRWVYLGALPLTD